MSLVDIYRTRVSEDVEARLKDKTKEIVRCYRHSWDIFSELVQNAVDAINRRYRILNDPDFYLYDEYRRAYGTIADQTYEGLINIRVDVANKVLEVEDNGVGIEPENLGRFLLPEETGKVLGQEYGFKGYGLTFAAFISQRMYLKSKHFPVSETYEIALDGLFDWLVDETDSVQFPTTPVPTTALSSDPLEESSTIVRIELEDNYRARFSAAAAADSAFEIIQTPDHWERFEYVLRSRTAIGNTRPLFNRPPVVPIDVNVTVAFPDGTEVNRAIPYRFYHPREHPEIRGRTYDFADYVQRLSEAAFSRTFRGLYHAVTGERIGTIYPVECDIALLACSSTRLSNIERSLELHEVATGDIDISSGVHLAIDGMPTGIRIDNWRGHDRQRFYAIVDAELDISNQLDSGRKGISRYYADLISGYVWDLINDSRIDNSDIFHRYVGRFLDVGRVTQPLPTQAQEFQQKVNDIRHVGQQQETTQAGLIQVLRSSTPLLYFPSDEQEVITVFYSLLSKNVIKGYTTVYLSSKATYDAAFEYEIECCAENLYPNDPLGIGELVQDQLRGMGISTYVHRERFAGITQSEVLCVEFKQTLGGFLQEVVQRPGQTDKIASDINLLIVWDDIIPSSIPSPSYTLAEIQHDQRIFHSTTHRLGLIGEHHTEVRCIVLSEVLERLSGAS
jgi:hypothetical protein